MGQNLIPWIPLIVALLGSFGWGIKKILELQSENSYLKIENENLREERDQANRIQENLKDRFKGLLERTSDINEIAKLEKISENFKTLDSQIPEFEKCREAAARLQECHEIWLNESSDFALRKYSSLVPNNQKNKFKQDISGFLDWAFISLDLYGHSRVPLSEYVNNPSKQFVTVYLSAIRYIKDKEDWGELSPEAVNYLKTFLEELDNKIRYEI